MSDLKYTAIEEIEKIHSTLYKTFRTGTCRLLEYRRKQLYAVARMCQENVDTLQDALHKDLGKPRLEGLGYELSNIVQTALENAKQLEEWSKPEVVDSADYQKSWSPTINKTPKGPVLIITPWNFPLGISVVQLIAAIASGNPAIVKPSELTPTVSQRLGELVPKYLDQSAYAVVNGAVKETTRLLELKWAHIHYTGNGRIARVIAAAAAKHLTPVSLELGGKSPVVIDSASDINLAAKRILYGKTLNAGQVCVAPDYVLVPKERQEELVKALKEQSAAFYPDGPFKSDSLARIVSPTHFARLKGLLERSNGKVVVGGSTEEKTLKFEPTIVTDVTGDDALMSEEIFGPILPIIPTSSIDEAIDFVNSRDHPLVLYVFTDNPEVKKRFVNETLSGALTFNDTVNLVKGLPFGGVGESGYGSQGLRYGFDDFTLNRSTFDVPKEAEPLLGLRYPPFRDEATKAMSAGAFQPIPA